MYAIAVINLVIVRVRLAVMAVVRMIVNSPVLQRAVQYAQVVKLYVILHAIMAVILVVVVFVGVIAGLRVLEHVHQVVLLYVQMVLVLPTAGQHVKVCARERVKQVAILHVTGLAEQIVIHCVQLHVLLFV